MTIRMKRGVALSGGGSRGAYELGVWTSLRENNIDFQLVTGASIGALNGALMAQGDYEPARRLWRELTVDRVMENGINLDVSIERMLNQRADLMPFLKKYVEYGGADITPLKNLLREVIDEPRLRASDVNFGLVAVDFPTLQPYELAVRDIPKGRLVDWLLASAACFPAFPMQKIGDKTLIDGGYYDNLPIPFAFRLGADEVVAVGLERPPIRGEYLRHPYVTYIYPSWNLGSFLLFDPAVMAKNTTLGYNDAQKAFGKFFGFRYAFRGPSPESAYREESARFYGFVTQLEARVNDPGRRGPRRLGVSPVTDFLREYTERPLSPFEYLVRSLETCAELLELDHLPVYDFSDFIRLLREELADAPITDASSAFWKVTANRAARQAAPKREERRQALAGLYRGLREPRLSYSDAEAALLANPRGFAAALGPAALAGAKL